MGRSGHRAQPPEDEARARVVGPRCYAQCKSRRQDKNRLANIRLIDHTIGWADEPKDELSDQVMDVVWTIPQGAGLNARRRKISWADGQELTVNQSVDRIHADHLHFPPELIENHLIGQIEQVMVSSYDSELRATVGRTESAH